MHSRLLRAKTDRRPSGSWLRLETVRKTDRRPVCSNLLQTGSHSEQPTLDRSTEDGEGGIYLRRAAS